MKWKSIAVITACSLVFGATGFAAGNVESIRAYLNHEIKFTINSKPWVPQDNGGITLSPIILNGTTYLPAKAIVEATGGQVQWNEATKTIAIISATQTKETVPISGEVKERDQKVIEKMNEIKKKLKLGLTKEEVQALFNEKFEIAHNSDSENGSDSYSKYEYFKAADYQGESDTRIDVDSLMERKLGAFLYIEWKKNKLYMYSISYLNPKDHKVHLYMMGYDGKISDIAVSD